MATINGTTNNSYYIVYLNAYEKDYSVQNNTSTVVVELHMKRTSGSYLRNGGSYNGSITVDGVTQNYSGTLPYPTAFYEGTDKTYAILTFYNIHHDDNGSKTVSISATYNANFSPESGSVNGGYLRLTDIPRATNCPSITGYIKSSYNIPLSPASNSFTHSIYITFGNIKKWLQSNGTLGDSEYRFSTRNPMLTLPKEFYSQFNGYSGTGMLTLYTYNGGTLIGTKSGTLIAQCNPAICSPLVISSNAIDVNEKTITLTKDKNNIIKFASEVLITPNIQIGDEDDSNVTIVSKSVNNNVFSTDTITIANPTDKSFTITLTNSRQLTTNNIVSASGSLINYIPLTMNVGKIYRPEPTTGEVKIQYNGNYYASEFGVSKDKGYVEVNDTLTSDNLAFEIPDNFYEVIQNILSNSYIHILETDKYKFYIGNEGGMMPHYFITMETIDTDDSNFNPENYIYAASFSDKGGWVVSTNLTKINSDTTIDLGTVTMTYDNNDVSHIFLNSDKSIESVPNTLDITWKYREKNTEDWIEGGTLSPVIDKNKNTYENEESLGTIFDYTKQYDFMFYCVDKINSITIEDKVQRGFPVFWWNSNSVHVLGDLYVRDRSILGGNAVYDYTLTENASSIYVDNLDMLADGGGYELIIYHSGTIATDTRITFNDIKQGYYQTGFCYQGTSTSSDSSLTSEGVYRPNKSSIYWGMLCSTSSTYPATITGRFFKQINNRIAWSLKNECSVAGRQWITFTTGVNDQNVENITSLQFFRAEGEFQAGTRIIIKRVV